MMGTIIMLYALSGTIEIPDGCFIAAWALFGIEVITRSVMATIKKNSQK